MELFTEKVIAVVDHEEQGLASRESAWDAVRFSTYEFLGKRKFSDEQSIQLKDMKKMFRAYRDQGYSKIWSMGKVLLWFEDKNVAEAVLDKFYWGCK